MALNKSPSQLLPIPTGLEGEALTTAINDRLRRISPAVAAAQTSTTTTTAPTGVLTQITVTTSPYSIPAGIDVVTFATGASVATLPGLTGLARKPLWLIVTSAAAITLNVGGSDTAETKTSLTLYPGGRYQLMPNA